MLLCVRPTSPAFRGSKLCRANLIHMNTTFPDKASQRLIDSQSIFWKLPVDPLLHTQRLTSNPQPKASLTFHVICSSMPSRHLPQVQACTIDMPALIHSKHIHYFFSTLVICCADIFSSASTYHPEQNNPCLQPQLKNALHKLIPN